LAKTIVVQSCGVTFTTCGATATFWPDVEACEAVCIRPEGHDPADVHEDEILGEWTEDELTTWPAD
jgi:hypothetical protein